MTPSSITRTLTSICCKSWRFADNSTYNVTCVGDASCEGYVMHIHFYILISLGILLHHHVQENYGSSRYAVQGIHKNHVFTTCSWTVQHQTTKQASCATKASTPLCRICGSNTSHAGQGTVNETETNEKQRHVSIDFWDRRCVCNVFCKEQSASTQL